MTWTAPDVDRTRAAENGNEDILLPSMLDHMRQTLLQKCAGLTEEELKKQPLGFNNQSLLALIRHMADVELFWFRLNFKAEDVEGYYHRMDDPDAAWNEALDGDVQQDFANYAESVAKAKAIAADHSFDDTFTHFFTREESNLRFIYVHLIREYARHCGHADFLREAIDGKTGE